MRQLGRWLALAMVFGLATSAWMALGGVMTMRTGETQAGLRGAVADLWGEPLVQAAPRLTHAWTEEVVTEETVLGADGKPVQDAAGHVIVRQVTKPVERSRPVELASTDIAADLHLDPRRKGLLWFALYDVDFSGHWTYVHDGVPGTVWIAFSFPVADGVYDDFRFTVDGVERSGTATASSGTLSVPVEVEPGAKVDFAIGYRSRGVDSWAYRPVADGEVGQLEDFHLVSTTDFAAIDHPPGTLSPSSSQRRGDGWTLDWTFRRLVTGHGMGVTMPQRVQPGPLAAAMSFSAPLSLGLFLLWIEILALLRGLDVHPINQLFVAASFFAFHLLFGYTADHLPVEAAFGLSAVVSVGLVVSYLRLVVGPRFAWREAGLAQLLYLVGFSLAHFWEGWTGLTVTVLGIVTLFAVMQLTGRVRWSDVIGGTADAPRRAPVSP